MKNDESYYKKQIDGVTKEIFYTTDSFTGDLILQKSIVTIPSGLSKTATYNTIYDGNATRINTKIQTITTNGKSATLFTDYNSGIRTLTTPQKRKVTSSYDIDTLLTKQITAGTLTPTTFSYDEKGRVISESTGTRVTSYTYDNRGNIASITNPRGETTSYSYDIMDRVATITYPNNTTEHFSYDNNGNLLTRTTPTPAQYSFSYNGVNQRVSNKDPLNHTQDTNTIKVNILYLSPNQAVKQ